MNLKQWNELQIEQSLSDTNRYYFKLHYGRDATGDAELLLYFIEEGSKIFREQHRREDYEQTP